MIKIYADWFPICPGRAKRSNIKPAGRWITIGVRLRTSRHFATEPSRCLFASNAVGRLARSGILLQLVDKPANAPVVQFFCFTDFAGGNCSLRHTGRSR